MTVTKQYVADMKDLRAIRLTCQKCDTVLELPLQKQEFVPPGFCPNEGCHEVWFPRGSNAYARVLQLMATVKELSVPETTKTPIIRLTIENLAGQP